MIHNKVNAGKIGLVAALFIAIFFTGCDKNETQITQEVIDETAFAENVFAQLSADIEDAVPFEAVSGGRGVFGGFGLVVWRGRTHEDPSLFDFRLEHSDRSSAAGWV